MSSIQNEQSFDNMLNNLASKINVADKAAINKAGMAIYEKNLKSKLSEHTDRAKPAKGYPAHLEDTLVTNVKPDGSSEIGFSKVGKKAYIGRFLNDGHLVFNQYGGSYGYVAGEHFWEETTIDSKAEVDKAMANALRMAMHRKMLGG